jgi:serine/threonine protein kinase
MQYVHGSSIRDLIAEAAPLPLEWVAAIGLQIAAVLACAHRVSLIHRDLKPSNLLLTRDGAVKVIDFGVAALGVDAALSTLTPAGVIVGTATYQAPERMLGLYSPRSDLYSLGCVLRELAPDVDPLIDELTAHNPDDRPASAVDVITRLLPLLGTPPPTAGLHPPQRRRGQPDPRLPGTDQLLRIGRAQPRTNRPATRPRPGGQTDDGRPTFPSRLAALGRDRREP